MSEAEIFPVQRSRIDLTARAPSQRLAYWHDFVCGQLLVADGQAPSAAAVECFDGSITVHALGGVRAFSAPGQPFAVQRGADHARQADAELVVVVQREGTARLEQGNESVELHAGDIGLYWADQPSLLEFMTAFAQQAVILPGRDGLARWRGRRSGALKLRDDNPAAAVLRELAAVLTTDVGADARRHLQAAFAQAMQAALGAQCLQGFAGDGLADYHRARVRAYVKTRLVDPDLSVIQVAQAVRLSMSQLHRLFAGEAESLMEMVWRERLMASRQVLSARGNGHRSIEQIAFQCGFRDSAHFSRRFKAMFGLAPGQWRAQHAISASLPPDPGLT